MPRWFRWFAAVGMIWGMTSAVWAQGLLIIVDRPIPLPRPLPIPRPVPSASYALKALHVQAKLHDQAASVQVSQTVVNTSPVTMEVQFVFPLPYDGAIDQFTLLVDGKEYPAQLLPAQEARSRYESIVRSNRDPALLEWIGQGMLQTSVFPLPAGAERKLTLRYHQLLRKDQGLTDFLFPLSTAKYTATPIEKVEVHVVLESSQELKNIYSPTHAVEIQRSDPRRAVVKWSRTQEIPTGDFRLFYDVGQTGLAARVLSYKPTQSEDGYFLLLASLPIVAEPTERQSKTVVFVVDKSGSMSGKKWEQAQAALKFVLENLREGDLFNIVAYETSVESFRPELERYSEETRKAALGYVQGLYPGGGTNIHQALTTALSQLRDSSRPNYVLFLTDGLPTVGERNEAKIAQAAKASNQVRARVLPLGVGYDVNSRLLDRLARDNYGLSEYVRPNEDIESHVARVYQRIGSPVLTGISVLYEVESKRPEEGPPVNRIYPKQVVDLFEGEQLVLAGRYKKSGKVQVVIEGKTTQKSHRFTFPAEFVPHSPNATYAFVEKLWATRRIGEILDELDLYGKNEELVKELVELSTKHGILTPYTSFLADETARPRELALADRFRAALQNLTQLEVAEGRRGVAQRATKQELLGAATPLAAGFGGILIREVESDALVQRSGVRASGNVVTFLRRAGDAAGKKLLVTPQTAAIDLDQNKGQYTVIERFSEAYFALVAENSPEENQLLALQQEDEELLVQLRGKYYLIK